jgi:hypothetical protein
MLSHGPDKLKIKWFYIVRLLDVACVCTCVYVCVCVCVCARVRARTSECMPMCTFQTENQFGACMHGAVRTCFIY